MVPRIIGGAECAQRQLDRFVAGRVDAVADEREVIARVEGRGVVYVRPVYVQQAVQPRYVQAVGWNGCGAPAWDPDFNSADLPMMIRIGDLPTPVPGAGGGPSRCTPPATRPVTR